LEAFELWVWRRMERISWTEKITNMEPGSTKKGTLWERVYENNRYHCPKKMNFMGPVMSESLYGLLREVMEEERPHIGMLD